MVGKWENGTAVLLAVLKARESVGLKEIVKGSRLVIMKVGRRVIWWALTAVGQ